MTINEGLNSKFRAQLDDLPLALQESVGPQLDSLSEALVAFPCDLFNSGRISELVRVFIASEFVATSCIRNPKQLADLIVSGDLDRTYADREYESRLTKSVPPKTDIDTLSGILRKLRRREMIRIAWRDITGSAVLAQTMSDLSRFAEACIRVSQEHLQAWLQKSLGKPVNDQGETQCLLVLAMGKLGARELNFSSDIDLIFCYPQVGETTAGLRSVSNEAFFARLGRQLIAVLSNTTVDGFVFRVDMRLRPFGDSGPLAMSFDAMEHYYQTHGRDWERYAMVKARAITGNPQDKKILQESLTRFVYRRYLDFGSFDALREMKRNITAELKRKGLRDNIKLGPGGIREVEFIGQAFQLIRGGRRPALQARQIQKILTNLGDEQYLPGYIVDKLQAAYIFLRTVEHRLQEMADRQTHQLPLDPADRLRLAYSMGYKSWLVFLGELDKHRRHVHENFNQTFASPQLDQAELGDRALQDLWREVIDETAAVKVLSAHGYDQPQLTYKLMQFAKKSNSFRALSRQGHQRLDHLMPLLLGAVSVGDYPYATPYVTLKRLLELLETICRRTSYLALLAENPMVLSQLVKLCATSPWIGHMLSKQPVLLDELLDPRTLYTPPTRDQLVDDLARRLADVTQDDLEQQMETLRQFKQANVLRVAAADISDAVPLMVVSNHLTEIAEVILNTVLEIAWSHLVERHGQPSHLARISHHSSKGFAVIAYGKLGGIEFGYGSDLDLVFLYDGEQNAMTNGSKPLSNAVFYARLGQRMIHLLTAVTPAGILYEVDMRLRPSGTSGLLVTQVDALEHYQLKRAWVWEHQALVRGRPVAGDKKLRDKFSKIRNKVLSQPRESSKLRHEVVTMRERMRAELNLSKSGMDLKQGHGGIVDIEFMVQYMVLANAAKYPDLLEFTDNIRILEKCAAIGLIGVEEQRSLSDIYRKYRAKIHRLKLQERPAVVGDADFFEQRETVVCLWKKVVGP